MLQDLFPVKPPFSLINTSFLLSSPGNMKTRGRTCFVQNDLRNTTETLDTALNTTSINPSITQLINQSIINLSINQSAAFEERKSSNMKNQLVRQTYWKGCRLTDGLPDISKNLYLIYFININKAG